LISADKVSSHQQRAKLDIGPAVRPIHLEGVRVRENMNDVSGFRNIPPTTLADGLGREQVMDIGIRPLWPAIPRVAGPAFTVRCPPGDNLMLHAAIYRAEPGSVIVVEAGDNDYAVAGGNVCAVAQRRGVEAFVVDGVIRDLAEVREMGFPVFARGVIPIPGTKRAVEPLNGQVRCGGVNVNAGDIVVADEEGIVVTPRARHDQVLRDAQTKLAKEAGESLDSWEEAHRARINKILRENGFEG
jgi:4-hydroxy-4-methyl-2-oxoglutarate aldolase